MRRTPQLLDRFRREYNESRRHEALEQLKPLDEDEWSVYFGRVQLGYLVTRDGKPRIEPLL